MDMEQTCCCGLIKQGKAGTSMRGDGVEVCNACGLPVQVMAVASNRSRGTVPIDKVTTLAELPGHRIVATLGLVSELSSASGLTATSKGEAALDKVLPALRRSAEAMGANAIVAVTASAFGAGGGITGVFGGDAVGVLLMGTAVVVARDDELDLASP